MQPVTVVNAVTGIGLLSAAGWPGGLVPNEKVGAFWQAPSTSTEIIRSDLISIRSTKTSIAW